MRFDGLDVGLVVAVHGRHAFVEDPEGKRLLCHPRGKKSDVVVGDRVRWQAAGDEGVIEHIEPRRNLLFRQDEWRTKSFAANIDQLLVLVSGEPMFSESQLTRALIAAQSTQIPACIVLNKTDLPSAALARERLAPYAAMGVQIIELAMKTQTQAALEILRPLLQDKHSFLLGPSGTGKSTMINLLAPQAAAQVGEISKALNSGRHTTTSTTWYWMDAARRTALIDSPGFQEFGLRQLQATELPQWMPDLRAHLGHCRFYNCSHQHEPGCGIRQAIQDGLIDPRRHALYIEILAELNSKRW